MNRGIAFGVGVGPGDPELMTLKACRLIRENEVIAVPGKIPQESVAYRIAAAAVPELSEKKLLPVYMPMVKDRAVIEESNRKVSYIQHLLEKDGYEVQLVSGITSFCAAAATLGTSLAEWNQPLHIIPALHYIEDALEWPGNYVLMKSASRMSDVKKNLLHSDLIVQGVENCTMDNEKIYRSLEEIPDEAGSHRQDGGRKVPYLGLDLRKISRSAVPLIPQVRLRHGRTQLVRPPRPTGRRPFRRRLPRQPPRRRPGSPPERPAF